VVAVAYSAGQQGTSSSAATAAAQLSPHVWVAFCTHKQRPDGRQWRDQTRAMPAVCEVGSCAQLECELGPSTGPPPRNQAHLKRHNPTSRNLGSARFILGSAWSICEAHEPLGRSRVQRASGIQTCHQVSTA
jgi:hypothetical protein